MKSILMTGLVALLLPFCAQAQQDDSNDNHGGDPSPSWEVVYVTECSDEPRLQSYETGRTVCSTKNIYEDHSADFGGSGNCKPEVVTVQTMVSVCKRVAKWIPRETCTGPLAGAGSSCGGNGD